MRAGAESSVGRGSRRAGSRSDGRWLGRNLARPRSKGERFGGSLALPAWVETFHGWATVATE